MNPKKSFKIKLTNKLFAYRSSIYIEREFGIK